MVTKLITIAYNTNHNNKYVHRHRYLLLLLWKLDALSVQHRTMAWCNAATSMSSNCIMLQHPGLRRTCLLIAVPYIYMYIYIYIYIFIYLLYIYIYIYINEETVACGMMRETSHLRQIRCPRRTSKRSWSCSWSRFAFSALRCMSLLDRVFLFRCEDWLDVLSQIFCVLCYSPQRIAVACNCAALSCLWKNHSSNTTCLTHVFFKSGESCSKLN